MKKLFGLIGFPLSHSFSKKYFSQKFEEEQIENSYYELYELKEITEVAELFRTQPNLKGLNVTIPYKQQIIQYLDEVETNAQAIGAVNTIKFEGNKRIGYNSDYFGFKESLERWSDAARAKQALILGTGGASLAVKRVLLSLGISFQMVSRTPSKEAISYLELRQEHDLTDFPLVINTTPLGMSPRVDTYPDICYEQLSGQHYCYDLVYNPASTAFMQKSQRQGAQVKNGMDMLRLQAEKSWEIWNSDQ